MSVLEIISKIEDRPVDEGELTAGCQSIEGLQVPGRAREFLCILQPGPHAILICHCLWPSLNSMAFRGRWSF